MRVALLMTATVAIAQAVKPTTPIGCSMLSPTEIEAATGIPVATGVTRFHSATLMSCSFRAGHGGEIRILVRRALTRQWISEEIGRMQRGAYQEIPGIGDRFFLYTLPDVAILCVFDADFCIQLSFSGLRDRPLESAKFTLARLVAARAAGTTPLATP